MSCCVSLIFSDDSKQDAATTISHIKHTIESLKQGSIMSNKLSKIWQNKDGCAKHYICATELYLISMLSQDFYVIIERGISAPGYGRQLADVLNATVKRFLLQLISTVQLPGAKSYDTQMVIHIGTRKFDVRLARKSQKHLSGVARKHGVIYQNKYKNGQVNKRGQRGNIMFRMMMMFFTKMLKHSVIQNSFHHFHFVLHTKNHMVSEG